ncbi:MAG: 3-hydroxyacyl-ACP dehydratase FabZ [Candidatus Auribacterota bacterium]|nr:3-hydroxyacyl-ACP dehydratase FabZ [Candidatus Auribacterota bacterium]
MEPSQQTRPTTLMNIEQIRDILPHRYPFLLVDRILELEPGKKIVGIKNVTMNEEFFQGHFPIRPVMPGVLIVEALAQVAGVMMLREPENQNKLAFFMAIDQVKFRKPVVPGDQLRLEVEVIRWKTRAGKVHGEALVDGKVVCQADLTFSLIDPN